MPAGVVIYRNPFRLTEREVCVQAPGRLFIEFLLERFPDGFEVATTVFLNGDILPLDDFDHEFAEDDAVVIFQGPGFDPITISIIGYLVSAAISMAASFLLNALFGGKPSTPTSINVAEASPVYSISSTQNRARIGQPVPAVYGEVITTPDLGSQPYTYFADNDQFLVMMLVIGQGIHDLGDFLIDDTPTSDILDTTVFETFPFLATEHNQVFGFIEDDSGLWENVHTSVEVGDQELLFGKESNVNDQFLFNAPNQMIIQGASTFNSEYESGKDIVIAGVGSQDGTYTILSISQDRKTLTTVENTITTPVQEQLGITDIDEIFQWQELDPESSQITAEGHQLRTNDDISFLVPGQSAELDYPQFPSGSNTITVQIVTIAQVGVGRHGIFVQPLLPLVNIGDYTWTMLDPASNPFFLEVGLTEEQAVVGYFTAANAGTVTRQIDVDVVFPSGLYRVNNNGSLGDAVVEWRIEIQEIDDLGADIGAPIVNDEDITLSTNTPQRRSFEYPVSDGRYKVRATRLNEASGRAQDQSRIIWSGLKAILRGPATPVYGEAHIAMVKIRATNGIANTGQRKVRVNVARHVAIDGNLGNVGVTKNPADAFFDIYTNTTYGGGRPASEIDLAALNASHAYWALSPGFNAVFDSKSTVFDSMRSALGVVVALPVPIDGSMSILQDGVQATRKQLFSSGNITPGSFQIGYSFLPAGDADGFQVEFRDPITFQAAYEVFPLTSIAPQAVNLFGCTDRPVAAAYAELLFLRKTLQRKSLQFDTELEGHVAMLGDRVAVSHTLPMWGEAGLVVDQFGVVPNVTLIVDIDLDWTGIDDRFLMLRDIDGSTSEPEIVTRGAADNEIVLAGSAPGTVRGRGHAQPTIFAFGKADVLVHDFQLTDLEHKGGVVVAIRGTVYNPDVFATIDSIIGQAPL